MIESTPFTENANEHESEVFRLVVYLSYCSGGKLEGTIEQHNETFEFAEKVLDRLGSAERALTLRIADGRVQVGRSEELNQILEEINQQTE